MRGREVRRQEALQPQRLLEADHPVLRLQREDPDVPGEQDEGDGHREAEQAVEERHSRQPRDQPVERPEQVDRQDAEGDEVIPRNELRVVGEILARP